MRGPARESDLEPICDPDHCSGKFGPTKIRRVEFAVMTTREKAHALLDELPDSEIDEIVKHLEFRHEERDEPEMAELPEAWRYLPSGAPAPNWVAALDEARRGR